MPKIAIVADDLTGAADAAGTFASAGFTTAVALARSACPDADVVAISTDSRDRSPTEAEAAVRAGVRWLLAARGGPPRLIYKKIDSALRGHIWEEIAATLSVSGERRALIAPALPAQGRTVVGGRVLVHGMPLGGTALAGPAEADDILRAPRALPDNATAGFLDLESLRSDMGATRTRLARHDIVVADAETDDDLDLIAARALAGGFRVLAGSAGLARALARHASFDRPSSPAARPRHPTGPVLVVAGTRHAATAAQVALAQAKGVIVVRPKPPALAGDDGALSPTTRAVTETLAAGHHVILTTAGCPDSPLGARFVAERLAEIVDRVSGEQGLGGLVLTGGDVAAAVCSRLGVDAIWLEGEIAPAVPVGHLSGGRCSGKSVVTKAGSFGDEAVLVSAIVCLAGPVALP